jgi:hypothetical protein
MLRLTFFLRALLLFALLLAGAANQRLAAGRTYTKLVFPPYHQALSQDSLVEIYTAQSRFGGTSYGSGSKLNRYN